MELSLKKLLQKYHFRPDKRLGQHFLISRKALQKIIQAAKLSKEDVVLEIGPGLGILTEQLAQKVKRVVAVEKDERMVRILKETLKDCQNAEIIQGDILKIKVLPSRFRDFAENKIAAEKTGLGRRGQKALLHSGINYKLVANIPYYLTSPLIRLFLEAEKPPQMMVLLIQKEVAQRICAQPPKMSLLAVAVQFYSQPKIVSSVSKKSFWPQPKVDSAIIKIVPRPPAMTSQESRKKFFQIVKAGFVWPRKQLANNLSRKLSLDREEIKKALTERGLNPQVRAENLSVEDWQRLASIIASMAERE